MEDDAVIAKVLLFSDAYECAEMSLGEERCREEDAIIKKIWEYRAKYWMTTKEGQIIFDILFKKYKENENHEQAGLCPNCRD